MSSEKPSQGKSNRIEKPQLLDREDVLLEKITRQWAEHRCLNKDTLRSIGYSSAEFYQSCLDKHPAAKLSDKVENVNLAFSILSQSRKVFIDVVGQFHSRLTHDLFGDLDLESIGEEVARLTYTYSCAAYSLVQAYRHLFSDQPERLKLYDELRKKFLNKPEIIKFIADLRTNNNHLYILRAKPHYSVKLSRPQEVKSGVGFNKKAILESNDWSKEAKDLLNQRPEIQIIDVINEHFEMAAAIKSRVLSATGILDDIAYQDFGRIKLAREAIGRLASLGIILQVAVPQKVDPYPHLEGRFTPDELANIYGIAHRSKEQVDYIISLRDPLDFCTESTRNELYKLFGVQKTEDSA